MDRSDIEEMAKDLLPLAESTNAGEAVMSTDYDDKWEFFMGFRKKRNIGRNPNPKGRFGDYKQRYQERQTVRPAVPLSCTFFIVCSSAVPASSRCGGLLLVPALPATRQ